MEVAEKVLRGISYGGKHHILDCMDILNMVWYIYYRNYFLDEIVYHYCIKVDTSLPTWNSNIENN